MRDPATQGVAICRADLEADPAFVAPMLLGACLVRTLAGRRSVVRLVEVEAYRGSDDPGSHAYRGATSRNRVMFGPAGCAYVYFTYGSHFMLNVVCGPEGRAGGVLLRGAEPVEGVDAMTDWRQRGRHVAPSPPLLPEGRPSDAYVRWLLAGPARLAAALGVNAADNGLPMTGEGEAQGHVAGRGFLLVHGGPVAAAAVRTSGRIGLSRAQDLPLRFYLASSPGVSRARPAVPQPPGQGGIV